jgi:ABC-2 type transport system permease protein
MTMRPWSGIDRIWRLFIHIGLRSRRIRLFVFLSLLAPAIQLLVSLSGALPVMDFFNHSLLVYYIQLFIPLLAIFIGSAVVNDELDDKTLVYLITRPVPRPAILLGKYGAYLTLALAITGGGFALAYMIAFAAKWNETHAWLELLNYLGVAALALFAYSALFTLLGTFVRKAIVIGLFFVFGWESAVQFLPGITQRFSLIHWVKSLLPALPREVRFLIFHLEPSSPAMAVAMLLLTGVAALAGAALIFRHRAYILSDSI